ncbi:MAG: hypothetical protein H6Q00_408 [Holophagaceae bacterium]|nr:hypothetical protein [Holophagaceae bacterium]
MVNLQIKAEDRVCARYLGVGGAMAESVVVIMICVETLNEYRHLSRNILYLKLGSHMDLKVFHV